MNLIVKQNWNGQWYMTCECGEGSQISDQAKPSAQWRGAIMAATHAADKHYMEANTIDIQQQPEGWYPKRRVFL